MNKKISFLYLMCILLNLYTLSTNIIRMVTKYGCGSFDIFLLFVPIFGIMFMICAALKMQSNERYWEERRRASTERIETLTVMNNARAEIDRLNDLLAKKDSEAKTKISQKEKKKEKIEKRVVKNAMEEIEV